LKNQYNTNKTQLSPLFLMLFNRRNKCVYQNLWTKFNKKQAFVMSKKW